jgi:hypothetical protein
MLAAVILEEHTWVNRPIVVAVIDPKLCLSNQSDILDKHLVLEGAKTPLFDQTH